MAPGLPLIAIIKCAKLNINTGALKRFIRGGKLNGEGIGSNNMQREINCPHCGHDKFSIKYARDPITACANCHTMQMWPDANGEAMMQLYWQHDKCLYEEGDKLWIGAAEPCHCCRTCRHGWVSIGKELSMTEPNCHNENSAHYNTRVWIKDGCNDWIPEFKDQEAEGWKPKNYIIRMGN